MKEIWKQTQYPEYYISNLGRVKSIKFNKGTNTYKEKIIKTHKQQTGYLSTTLCIDGKVTTVYVHRLVATAFLKNPNNLPQINHKSGIKDENTVDNLEWCDASWNGKHAYQIGLKEKNCIPVGQYDTNGNLIKIWSGLTELHNEGFNKYHIRHHILYVPKTTRERKLYHNSLWFFLRDFDI
jgi:hypothetical protein